MALGRLSIKEEKKRGSVPPDRMEILQKAEEKARELALFCEINSVGSFGERYGHTRVMVTEYTTGT